MTTIKLTLPDQLAEEARSAGLLTSARLEQWLREQLKNQHIDELFSAMDRMGAVDEPSPLSPKEVALEIAALRADKSRGIAH